MGWLQLCRIASCHGKAVGIPLQACEQRLAAGQPAAVWSLCTALGRFMLCASSTPSLNFCRYDRYIQGEKLEDIIHEV